MKELTQVQTNLFEEMELAVRTSVRLMAKVQNEHLSFRPHENMRTLQELIEHLASVPAVDLLILQENKEEQIRSLESEYTVELGMEALGEKMRAGMNSVSSYMEQLSVDDFLNKKTAPFYLEHGSSQAKWLIEIVTHLFHHRSQLFTYMKMNGCAINMFDLY